MQGQTAERFLWAVLTAGGFQGLFGQMLYVANNGERTILSYIYDQDNGSLGEIRPRVATAGTPSSVAIHPNAKFVFVTTAGPPALTGYRSTREPVTWPR